MVNNECAIAYKEVLEILKYIPEEDFNKIHNDTIEMFKTYSDKKYIFSYNPSKTLDEQNVSKRAKAIIGILFRDYWATPTQRKKIIEKQQYERYKLEEEKKLKYNYTNFLNNNNISEIQLNKDLPISSKKENYFKKIFNNIKKLFFK